MITAHLNWVLLNKHLRRATNLPMLMQKKESWHVSLYCVYLQFSFALLFFEGGWSVGLSVCLFVCLSVCLPFSLCASVGRRFALSFFCLSVCLSVFRSVCFTVSVYLCMFVGLFCHSEKLFTRDTNTF